MTKKTKFKDLTKFRKLQSCAIVRDFVTLNSVSKDNLKEMFDWLFDEYSKLRMADLSELIEREEEL